MSANIAFYGLLFIAAALLVVRVRQIVVEDRETAFDAHADDAIRVSEPPTPHVSEGPLFLDEWSDTPVFDAVAYERLRDGLSKWGRE